MSGKAILHRISLDMSLLVETMVRFHSENLALHLHGRKGGSYKLQHKTMGEKDRCRKQHSEEAKGYMENKHLFYFKSRIAFLYTDHTHEGIKTL